MQGSALWGHSILVVLTEVIEHLPIHPVDVLDACDPTAAAGGFLYLTTPNFFAQAHLEQLGRGENPCAVYPAGDGNWDAHHHYREYDAIELAGFIAAAGGRVEAFYFSRCCDPPDVAGPSHRREAWCSSSGGLRPASLLHECLNVRASCGIACPMALGTYMPRYGVSNWIEFPVRCDARVGRARNRPEFDSWWAHGRG